MFDAHTPRRKTGRIIRKRVVVKRRRLNRLQSTDSIDSTDSQIRERHRGDEVRPVQTDQAMHQHHMISIHEARDESTQSIEFRGARQVFVVVHREIHIQKAVGDFGNSFIDAPIEVDDRIDSMRSHEVPVVDLARNKEGSIGMDAVDLHDAQAYTFRLGLGKRSRWSRPIPARICLSCTSPCILPQLERLRRSTTFGVFLPKLERRQRYGFAKRNCPSLRGANCNPECFVPFTWSIQRHLAFCRQLRANRKGRLLVKSIAAEIQSLSVELPKVIRTNDYWRERFPEIVQNVEDQGRHKVWSPPADSRASSIFLEEMAPYLPDPFRGTIERRALAPGQTSLDLECIAARKALDALGIGPRDIDITLCASFLGDYPGLGNGAFLARELGLSGPAWNIESTCAGGLVGLDMASSLIGSGRAKKILVVTSCDYSRRIEDKDVLSWTSGDGAAAFVVGQATGDRGILGSFFTPTTSTCGSLYFEYCEKEPGAYGLRMQCTAEAGRLLRETSEDCIRRTCEQALAEAGLTTKDVAHYIFTTPTAWYANFCARSLGIDRALSVDTHPYYANIGPVCWLANLYERARIHGIRADDIVLMCAIGSVSSVGAIVARFGSMALG